MLKKITPGLWFTAFVCALFMLFCTALILFFRKYTVTAENNILYQCFFVGIFIALTALTAFFIFKSRNKVQFTSASMMNIALLGVLITTVLSVPVSVYTTIIFADCAMIYAIIHKKIHAPHPLFYFIAGYYIFQLVGLSWSIDIHNGLKTVDKGISYLLIPFAFSCYIISDNDRNRLLRIFFRIMLVFIFIGLIGYVFEALFSKNSLMVGFTLKKNYLGLPDANHKYIFGWADYGHPTFISFILSLVFGIGFYLSKTLQTDRFRITNVELVTFAFAGYTLIFLLQSRIGMAMFPVAVFLSIFWHIRKRKTLFYMVLSTSVILLSIGLYVIFMHSNYFVDITRINLWYESKKFILEHPWFGTGTGGMQQIVKIIANPHNQYYGEILHLGIIGAIVLWTLIAATVYYAFKSKSLLLILFIVLILILMLIEMPFSIQKGVTYFTLFTGLFIRPEWKKV